MELLPPAFLFRFAVPVPYAAGRPKRGRWPVGDDVEPLPLFSRLNRVEQAADRETIELRAVWNEDGFGVSAVVTGLVAPPVAKADAPADGDGLHIWIDTRNAQGVHRASRFCRRFAVLPAVGGGKSAKALVADVPIAQAKDTPPRIDFTKIRLAADVGGEGYRVEAWFPATVLHGYDPENVPRLGFHAVVRDRRSGDRSLTVGDEFPVDHDPDLWTTLDLVRA